MDTDDEQIDALNFPGTLEPTVAIPYAERMAIAEADFYARWFAQVARYRGL